MELEEVIQELKSIGDRLFLKVNPLECYLFGSILQNDKLSNDIDILIIYENQGHVKILKEEFKLMSTHYPLHLNYFSFSEEVELNFIKGQKKILKIFTL